MTDDRNRSSAAFWATAILLLPVVYVTSFGPACWLTAKPRLSNFQQLHPLTTIFWPLGKAAMWDSPAGAAVRWWMLLGVQDGYVAVAPQNFERTGWFVLKKGEGLLN